MHRCVLTACAARASRRAPLLAAAAASVVSTCLPSLYSAASAQTWNGSTTGVWSNAANWTPAVPVAGATTTLTFGGAGAVPYTATNDLGANFQLNALIFQTTGTGVATIDGSSLSLSGVNPAINMLGSGTVSLQTTLNLASTTTFGGTGTGTVTLSQVASNPASTGTSGAALVNDNANGNLVMAGNLPSQTLYGLRLSRGNTFINSGTYTLSSTQRGNDPRSGANDGGHWGLVVGDVAGVTSRLTVSGGAVINPFNAFVANAPGSIGIATFTGAGTTVNVQTGSAEGRIGTGSGAGTINILNGATVTTRLMDVVRNEGTGFVLVDGAGSKLTVTQDLRVPASTGNGTMVVSGGALVDLTDSNLWVGTATNAILDPQDGNGAVTITGAGSRIVITGNGIGGGDGGLHIAQALPFVNQTGTVNVLAGGTMSSVVTFVGGGDGVGTLNLSGTGSAHTNSATFTIGSTTASRLSVNAGASFSNTGTVIMSSASADKSILTVGGTNSVVTIGGGLVMSGTPFGNTATGASTLNVNGGGQLTAANVFTAENPNSFGTIAIDGANSRVTANTQLLIANDSNTRALTTVTNGGQLRAGTAAFIATNATAIGTVNISGAGSGFTSTGASTQLHVGGNGTLDAGTATFNLTDNASAAVAGLAQVYTKGNVNVGSGTSPASFVSGSTVVNGTVNFNSGNFSTGTLAVGNRVQLSTAARNVSGTPSNKKLLEAGTVTLTASGVIDLNDNDALFHSTSYTATVNAVKNARNNGAWNQPGITSTAAKNAAPANKTLGVLRGDEWTAANGAGLFNGKAIVATDTLVKFTYYGDATFDGRITFDDYAKIDTGFNAVRTGWFNGDFNYDGVINFDDYGLIDQAFLTQGSEQLARPGGLAGPDGDRVIVAASIDVPSVIAYSTPGSGGVSRAVPEPASVVSGLTVIGGLLARRRRSHGGFVGKV